MDITALFATQSGAIANAAKSSTMAMEREARAKLEEPGGFDSIMQTAMDNLNTTNAYLSDAEDAEIQWALGETDNTHDLTIALQKAQVALQYTVAIRDKLLDAYKEIMQIQI